jgi:hypothetical protein
MQVLKSQGGWHQKDTKILKGSKRDQKGLKKEHVFFLMEIRVSDKIRQD